jgi:hypothetical protein
MCGTCSGQYLCNLQACQYKICKKEDLINSKMLFLYGLHSFYNVKIRNDNIKDLNYF